MGQRNILVKLFSLLLFAKHWRWEQPGNEAGNGLGMRMRQGYTCCAMMLILDPLQLQLTDMTWELSRTFVASICLLHCTFASLQESNCRMA